jgi:hypothetical protein
MDSLKSQNLGRVRGLILSSSHRFFISQCHANCQCSKPSKQWNIITGFPWNISPVSSTQSVLLCDGSCSGTRTLITGIPKFLHCSQPLRFDKIDTAHFQSSYCSPIMCKLQLAVRPPFNPLDENLNATRPCINRGYYNNQKCLLSSVESKSSPIDVGVEMPGAQRKALTRCKGNMARINIIIDIQPVSEARWLWCFMHLFAKRHTEIENVPHPENREDIWTLPFPEQTPQTVPANDRLSGEYNHRSQHGIGFMVEWLLHFRVLAWI